MIKDLATAQEIYLKIHNSSNILVITHKNPDGDGLGVLSALAFYLKSLDKKYQLFCLDQVPESCKFLPLMHEVSYDINIFKQDKYDLIIVLDSGSLDYAGVYTLMESIVYTSYIINIDHHKTNDKFGNLNLVIESASSASEIMYDLFRLWKVSITKDMATSLLNGIIFDTGVFSNAGTTLGSLKAASHLLNLGARHKEINENFIRNKSLNLLKLWGLAFERLEYNSKYQIAYTILTYQDVEKFDLEEGASEGLSNFFNELAGAKITMVLYEKEPGVIKGSLRTTFNDVDVSALAKAWGGGGGHQKAAGFTISGTLVYNDNKWKIIK